jgi:hypothetical protein
MVWLFPSRASVSPSLLVLRHIHQSIHQPTNRLIHQSIHQYINRSTMSQSSRPQSVVYTQSPLRNMTAQDSVQTASSTRASRSSRNVSLRDAIHSALGSGSPVDLLPKLPRRTSSYISNSSSNTTTPFGSRRSSSTLSNEITSSPTSSPIENAADSVSLQGGSDGKMPPVSWSLDDAVYATPAGKGHR